MRKIKEVLRLKFEVGLGNRQIARSCGVNHSTVAGYLRRAKVTGLGCWPLPELEESELEARLFPARPARESQPLRAAPNWAVLHEELRGDKHVTLQLLWEEYKQSTPDGYQYNRYCELYLKWAGKLDLVLRQEHRAGEKLFVDYADDTVTIVEAKTCELRRASIFVADLGASS